MTQESVFRIAFWILFGGILVMRVYFSYKVRQAGERLMPDRQAIEQEGRILFAIRVLLFFVMLAIVALFAIRSTWTEALSVPLPVWLRWTGFILGLASLALWFWVQVVLGKEWSPQLQLRQEHHLITRGPYAWVRHPMYTAMFGIGAAFALVSANWIFIAFAALVIGGSIIRAPREEQMMLAEFGEEYRAYMQRTGRFFPKL
jgi:protein-S-isoprenylcysteine O-methyltransferase Ste14